MLKLKRKVPHAPIFFPGRAPRSRDKKEENVVIGLCAFTGPPDPEGVVEITYSVAPSYLAKGCATEAVIALLCLCEPQRARPHDSRTHTRENQCLNTCPREMHFQNRRDSRVGK
ncbi:MAG: hypothetical protein DME96_10715 [Verrucomicrobia bacterium]|nr:MAG: hypothetical protein DME96_10715 [Verrucomicrobiota bacterium]